MASVESKRRIKDFSRAVQIAFQYLVDEYGFVCKGVKEIDMDSPKDAVVTITYLGKDVGVIIGWAMPEIFVTITELEQKDIPKRVSTFSNQKGLPRAISLDLLVKMRIEEGKEKPTSPLQEMGRFVSFTEMSFKRMQKYCEMLNERLEDVVQVFAERLRKYGSEILRGDTSIFPKVQEYAGNFYGGRWKKK